MKSILSSYPTFLIPCAKEACLDPHPHAAGSQTEQILKCSIQGDHGGEGHPAVEILLDYEKLGKVGKQRPPRMGTEAWERHQETVVYFFLPRDLGRAVTFLRLIRAAVEISAPLLIGQQGLGLSLRSLTPHCSGQYLCMGTKNLGVCFLGHCGHSSSCPFLFGFTLCFRCVGVSIPSFFIQLCIQTAATTTPGLFPTYLV